MLRVLSIAVLIVCAAGPAQSGQKEPFIRGKPASQWIKALEDTNITARRQALSQLYLAGAEAKPIAGAVARLLKSTDPTEKIYAALILGKIGPADKEAIPALVDALKDTNAGVRTQVALALGMFGEEVVPFVVAAAKDSKHPGRQNAISVLGALGPKAEKAVAALGELLEDNALRVSVATAMEKIGPSVIPTALKAAEKYPDTMFSILGRLKAEDAVPLLMKGLTDDSENVRQIAAQALGNIGPGSAQAIMGLMAALKDKNDNLRLSAIEALGKIGPAAKEAVDPLSEQIKPGESPIGFARPFPLQPGPFMVQLPPGTPFQHQKGSGTRLAVNALIAIAVDAPKATPTLIAMLKGKDFGERNLAASALSVIGKKAIPELTPILKEGEPVVRTAVADILGRIGGESKEAVTALGNALSDGEANVRQQATRSLGRLGSAAAPAIPQLAKTLADAKDTETRVLVIDVLGRVGGNSKEAATALGAVLSDTDADVVQYAALALGRIGPGAQAAVPQLRKLLASTQEGEVRGQAAQALGDLGPAAAPAIPDLLKGLKDGSEYVRQWSAYALGGIGPQAREAVGRLTELLRDQDPFVRRAARRALSKIHGEK